MVKHDILMPDVEFRVVIRGGGGVVYHTLKGLVMPSVVCCPWHHIK